MQHYGIQSDVGSFTSGYRESQKDISQQEREASQQEIMQNRETRADTRLGMDQETQGINMEKRQAELSKMRATAKSEGMVEATKLLLSGRTKDAEVAWNARGNSKIQPGTLKYDRKSGLVTWTEADGTQGSAKDRMLAAVAGVKWSDYTGKTTGGSKKIQEIEFYAKKVTGGDYKKAIKLQKLASSNPEVAFSKVLTSIRKENNKDPFAENKLTEDQMRQRAKETVDYFRNAQWEELMGKDKGAPRGLPEPSQPQDPSKGVINRTPYAEGTVLEKGGQRYRVENGLPVLIGQ